ncbi:MAG: hypothetical protein LM564_05260 [Desulfurococcaceae archaeon]|nr:hypothetical protein [Desulfurococcaceae archaeon]
MAAGILRKDGTVDYAAVLEVVALVARDEYLRQAIPRFTVENFRGGPVEDVQSQPSPRSL